MRSILLFFSVLYHGATLAQLKPVIQDDFSANTIFWETSHTKLLTGGNYTISAPLDGDESLISDAATLLRLSQNRVVTVRGYLVAHGIDEARITGTGYGDTRPIAAGDSEESRRLNRRVEFKITKK